MFIYIYKQKEAQGTFKKQVHGKFVQKVNNGL